MRLEKFRIFAIAILLAITMGSLCVRRTDASSQRNHRENDALYIDGEYCGDYPGGIYGFERDLEEANTLANLLSKVIEFCKLFPSANSSSSSSGQRKNDSNRAKNNRETGENINLKQLEKEFKANKLQINLMWRGFKCYKREKERELESILKNPLVMLFLRYNYFY
ncbi:MAG: hypothetical protein LBB13_00605 [Rickettsiales bacterium]|jgi:hypothetical protein|nr:hypothetical protein [Rickettsiales bacterium]